MLSEKDIILFSTYKKNHPNIVNDPRYQILDTDAERKSTFEFWMRSRITESKKRSTAAEKREMKKRAEEAFKMMLDEIEEKLHHDTTYEEICKICKHDER